jgi:hypothetical protein
MEIVSKLVEICKVGKDVRKILKPTSIVHAHILFIPSCNQGITNFAEKMHCSVLCKEVLDYAINEYQKSE